MDLNYFVCTLGEAAHVTGGRPYRDVNHLIIEQATNNPKLPAIGFYRVQNGQSGRHDTTLKPEILTFDQVHQGVLLTANLLENSLDDLAPGRTVGLLCSSSPEFLFTWLACIRLGHPVLLIAPECSAAATAELCQSCDVSLLFVDRQNGDLGKQTAEQRPDLCCIHQPFFDNNGIEVIKTTPDRVPPLPETHSEDVAYLHHTSGTSSGVPKPIPQSHNGAVGVLPAFDGRGEATFTTTPLYHGGPADTFRAWTSNAMIWLFPSKDLPITSANIRRCLECSNIANQQNLCPPIKYLGAVPYVLQTMCEDDQGIEWLKAMRLVSVGGAALPQEVGDCLVQEGVNLVSRFGSAECGFLLSSHRNYKSDKDWQYLRQSSISLQLKFEARDDGLDELVVLSEWPHMAKRNREDGSYATADLFEPHSHITNGWKYHSRADSQMTLATGKKFDPAPIEQAFVTSTSNVADALVFGNGRPFPGVLIFRSQSAADITENQMVQSFIHTMKKLDADSPSHAKIPRSMLILMPYSDSPLEKSSKGTILRIQAEKRYAHHIAEAYDKLDSYVSENIPDNELPGTIKAIVLRSVSTKSASLDETTDLFSYGVDSIAGIQIRHSLRKLLPIDAGRLPINVVEDCGSVKALASYIASLRHGDANGSHSDIAKEHQYMQQLVEQYSRFTVRADSAMANESHEESSAKEIVVLTGATGALGAHVLDQLRSSNSVSKIYCLVRGIDAKAAGERVDKALRQRQLCGLYEFSEPPGKVVILQSTLSDAKLGLDEELYSQLAREATTIIHLAWMVNFRMKLRSFVKDSIAGVQNLFNLAMASPRSDCPKFAFCSSVASVLDCQQNLIPEEILDDPSVASNTGYSQSKWVAEHICNRANKDPRMRGRVSIFRVGQVSGDSKTGIWNVREAWPLMLSSVKLTGCLPKLGEYEILNWLPVDVAAAAMVEGVVKYHSADEELGVFHVTNEYTMPNWNNLLRWLGKERSFDSVSPDEWIEKLEAAARKGSDHSALHLLDFWKQAYASGKAREELMSGPKSFETKRTRIELPALRDVDPVGEEYFHKLWAWIDANM